MVYLVDHGIVLDDVRGLQFLADNRNKLQETMVGFGSTLGGTRAFKKYLYPVPVAVTIKHSTAAEYENNQSMEFALRF